nr:hypothetical protein [Tanacetum cinerariifolium]
MVDDNVGNQVSHNAVQNDGNEVGKNVVQNPSIQIIENMNGLSVVSKIANQYGNRNLQIAQEEEARIQSTQKEFEFMDATDAYEETKRVKANCILENNLQQASTSEEQYTKLLEPISEPHEVPQNDSNVISEVSSVEQGEGIVEQHSTNVEETRV